LQQKVNKKVSFFLIIITADRFFLSFAYYTAPKMHPARLLNEKRPTKAGRLFTVS